MHGWLEGVKTHEETADKHEPNDATGSETKHNEERTQDSFKI